MVFGHRRLPGLKLRKILIQGEGAEPAGIAVLKTARFPKLPVTPVGWTTANIPVSKRPILDFNDSLGG